MRTALISIFATAMLAGTASAQVEREIIDNRPASSEADSVADRAPVAAMTAEERARRYSTSDNEAVITEAQPGQIDGVPEGTAPVRPHTAGENAVIDETPGTGHTRSADGVIVTPRGAPAMATHSPGENAVIDEKPGVGATGAYRAPQGEAPIRPHTEGENAVIDEKPGN